jgi:uncharacterized protein
LTGLEDQPAATGAGGRRVGRTRTCALTREEHPEAELIRFVAAPDGGMVADLKAKLPGRGVWLGAERCRVVEAVRKNVFARSLKAPVRAAADLPDQVAARLRDTALGRLGLARRAGVALAGFAKVEAALASEQVAALISASDGADDGRRKIEQAVFRLHGGAPPFPRIGLFSGAELGLAMGLPNVIHAAVLQSPAGKSFVEAAIRLQRYEGVGDGPFQDQAIAADEPQGVTDE